MLTATLLMAVSSAAQIYKWTDKSGTVHFSDSPPPRGAGAPKVEVRPRFTSRPVPTRTAAPPEEQTPESVVEAPRDQEDFGTADDYAQEPVGEDLGEDVGSDVEVIDGTAGDPAVRRRANSPRNRPGQPIRSAPRGRR
jgi:hypothetical protein